VRKCAPPKPQSRSHFPARDLYDAAIRAFWTGRDLQTQKQIESGKPDAGTRGAVTGGLHLTALQDVIATQFESLIEMGAVVWRSGIVPLPGFYRRAKNWDIVVTYNDVLVAAIITPPIVAATPRRNVRRSSLPM